MKLSVRSLAYLIPLMLAAASLAAFSAFAYNGISAGHRVLVPCGKDDKLVADLRDGTVLCEGAQGRYKVSLRDAHTATVISISLLGGTAELDWHGVFTHRWTKPTRDLFPIEP